MQSVQGMLQEMNDNGIPDSFFSEQLGTSREYIGKVRRGTKPGHNLLDELTPIYTAFKNSPSTEYERPHKTHKARASTPEEVTPLSFLQLALAVGFIGTIFFVIIKTSLEAV